MKEAIGVRKVRTWETMKNWRIKAETNLGTAKAWRKEAQEDLRWVWGSWKKT